MIYIGHLGSGLTLRETGLDALILICRPVSKMTVPAAWVSSDLMGAWP